MAADGGKEENLFAPLDESKIPESEQWGLRMVGGDLNITAEGAGFVELCRTSEGDLFTRLNVSLCRFDGNEIGERGDPEQTDRLLRGIPHGEFLCRERVARG